MKSRISLFNKTVLRKDITRFCPIWIIFAVVNLMGWLGNINILTASEENYLAAQLAWDLEGQALISFGYAIICALFLFGDLYKGRLCNALHALPLRRETWFATHTLAGILFFLVPNLAVAAICLPFMGQSWFVAPLWLLASLAMYLFFFALATVCIMLTGNRFAAGAVYILINFFSLLCYWLVETYYAPLLPGLHIQDTAFLWFCPVALLSSQDYFLVNEVEISYSSSSAVDWNYISHGWRYEIQGLTDAWLYIGIAAVLAIALFALGVVLYRRRKLESAGDFLAFRKPQPVFLVIFSLAVGAGFQTIFGLFDSNMVSMIIGLVIGSFAGQMLLRRTVKVFDKRSFLWCGFLACGLILTLVLTYIDPPGLTRWTPKPEQVTSITLANDYEYVETPTGGSIYYYDYQSVTVTDPEKIQTIVSVHQKILSQDAYMMPDSVYLYNPSLYPIHVTYHMDDGRDVVRRYYVTEYSLYQQLEPFFSDPEFILGYSDLETLLSHVDTLFLDGNEIRTAADARALLEAVWADCEDGHMNQRDKYYGVTDYYIDIQLDSGRYLSLQIYSDCENTLAWIKTRNNTK